MTRLIAPLLILALALPAAAQRKPLPTHNEELGLPYFAEGRGVVDHEAITRRALVVLDRQFSVFRDAAATLGDAARAHCDAGAPRDALVSAFEQAWLAWAPLDSWHIGPVEQSGAALKVDFWPDKKGFVERGVDGLLALAPERQRDPAVVASGSAAAEGLPALEALLYTDRPICPLAVGIAGNLSRIAAQLHQDWFGPDGWADLARAAGPDNPVYLSPEEFTKTLYTAVDYGMQRIEEARIARPLGTFERSFPRRAEAWRAGLSAAIIHAQLDGLAEMIRDGFAGDVREPERAWILKVIDQTHTRLDRIGQPIPDAVAAPESRVRVESVKTKLSYLRLELAKSVGPELGVDTGFSAADGD